ncbi:hypothetical protein BLNAU_2136 [Blattamonas nauphoetae]|uniref:Uncharacterized protein n=1 Tax=Blattamonas nauphoetae TaxID=2049346 RepID=A0ABQ9YFZ0_9EUKA|nr:hypothetical protein BLNAU_2136 [Blattamonas nauphoetae]
MHHTTAIKIWMRSAEVAVKGRMTHQTRKSPPLLSVEGKAHCSPLIPPQATEHRHECHHFHFPSKLSPPSVAPAVILRSRRNLTLIAKVLQTSVSMDTFETNESYLQNMAYPFIFSAHKLMLNKFCTDFVDVSMKFEYIEASPKLSDIPTFYNPSYSSFGVVPPDVHLPVPSSSLIILHYLVIAQ